MLKRFLSIITAAVLLCASAVFPARADELFGAEQARVVFSSWKNKFYKRQSTGWRIGNAGFWGDAEMMEILLDGYETSGEYEYREMFENVYADFCARNGTDSSWLGNDYNDDLMWITLACVRAYGLFGNRACLNSAKRVFDAVYDRGLVKEIGLIRWKEHNDDGATSCVNGPAAVAACYLGEALDDESYYIKAENLFKNQRKYIADPSSGKVYDWYNPAHQDNSYWSSSYNQGSYIGAALSLYQHYKNPEYLTNAVAAADYFVYDMCGGNVANMEGDGNDLPGFKGIFCRYLRRLIVEENQAQYIEWMQKNAAAAYSNRNAEGIINSAWDTKTPDSYFAGNSEFGASSAVSLAVNCPKEKSLFKTGEKIEFSRLDYASKVKTENNAVSLSDGAAVGFYNLLADADSDKLSVAVKSGSGKLFIRSQSPTGAVLGTIDLSAGIVAAQIPVVCDKLNLFFTYSGPGAEIESFGLLLAGRRGIVFSAAGTRYREGNKNADGNLRQNSACDFYGVNTGEISGTPLKAGVYKVVYFLTIAENSNNNIRFTPMNINGDKPFFDLLKKMNDAEWESCKGKKIAVSCVVKTVEEYSDIEINGYSGTGFAAHIDKVIIADSAYNAAAENPGYILAAEGTAGYSGAGAELLGKTAHVSSGEWTPSHIINKSSNAEIKAVFVNKAAAKREGNSFYASVKNVSDPKIEVVLSDKNASYSVKNGKIIVVAENGSAKEYALVITALPRVAKVKITNVKSVKAVSKGKKVKLKAQLLPAGADFEKVVWKSKNSKIAVVDSTGRVTAKRAGRVRIIASAGGRSAAVRITVKPERVKGIKVVLEKHRINISFKRIKGMKSCTIALYRDGRRIARQKAAVAKNTATVSKALESGRKYKIKIRYTQNKIKSDWSVKTFKV